MGLISALSLTKRGLFTIPGAAKQRSAFAFGVVSQPVSETVGIGRVSVRVKVVDSVTASASDGDRYLCHAVVVEPLVREYDGIAGHGQRAEEAGDDAPVE